MPRQSEAATIGCSHDAVSPCQLAKRKTAVSNRGYNPMNVFLTGASGFIGSHVAEVLARQGHTIGQPADVGIHLAWYVEPGKYLESSLNDKCRDDSIALVKSSNIRRWVVAGSCFDERPTTRYAHATTARTTRSRPPMLAPATHSDCISARAQRALHPFQRSRAGVRDAPIARLARHPCRDRALESQLLKEFRCSNSWLSYKQG